LRPSPADARRDAPPQPETAHRPVAADLGDVGPAVQWADDRAAAAGIDETTRFAIQICLEEVLANLILHGHPAGDRKDIEVGFAADAAGATLTVWDCCQPFDMSVAAIPALPSPADMQEGGQGLRLVHHFSTEISYRSRDGRNELTMGFRPTPDAAT
jgi:serine/threonine-protein kinase RsbW